jgi:hypothetical protein
MLQHGLLITILWLSQDDVIVIQKALSKDQIDEVISLSKEFRRPAEHVESKSLPQGSQRRYQKPKPKPQELRVNLCVIS